MYGLSILNDAKYSYSVLHKEVSLTVLRSPIWRTMTPLSARKMGTIPSSTKASSVLSAPLLPPQGAGSRQGLCGRLWA